MRDSNTLAEIQHDHETNHSRLIATAIEEEMDRVWDEVDDGKHDSGLFESVFIDAGTMARVARIQAMNLGATFRRDPDAGAMRDLYLQISDYVRDVAERRVLT